VSIPGSYPGVKPTAGPVFKPIIFPGPKPGLKPGMFPFMLFKPGAKPVFRPISRPTIGPWTPGKFRPIQPQRPSDLIHGGGFDASKPANDPCEDIASDDSTEPTSDNCTQTTESIASSESAEAATEPELVAETSTGPPRVDTNSRDPKLEAEDDLVDIVDIRIPTWTEEVRLPQPYDAFDEVTEPYNEIFTEVPGLDAGPPPGNSYL